MAEKEYRTVKDQISNGSILTVYGNTYLLSVNPCYPIDRVRFSLVKKGTGGKEASDVYLSVEEVRQFCSDIDRGIAAKKIADDAASQYPSAYKWTKGENGAKKLSIGGGQKGVRIQTMISKEGGKSDIKLMACQMTDLYQLSFMFTLTAGLIQPVGGYYKELYDAYWQNAGKRTFAHYDAAAEDATPETAVDDAIPDTPPKPAVEVFTVTTSGKPSLRQGYFGFPVIKSDDGEETTLVFSEAEAGKISWFEAFRKTVDAGTEKTLTFNGYVSGKCIRFVSLAS